MPTSSASCGPAPSLQGRDNAPHGLFATLVRSHRARLSNNSFTDFPWHPPRPRIGLAHAPTRPGLAGSHEVLFQACLLPEGSRCIFAARLDAAHKLPLARQQPFEMRDVLLERLQQRGNPTGP